MKQAIINFHQDEENHWVAELACGHNQHVRHQPPWVNRPWTQDADSRSSMIGQQLECKKCDAGAELD